MRPQVNINQLASTNGLCDVGMRGAVRQVAQQNRPRTLTLIERSTICLGGGIWLSKALVVGVSDMSNILSRVLFANIIGSLRQILVMFVVVHMVVLSLLIMRLKSRVVPAVTAGEAARDLDMIIRRAETRKSRTMVIHLYWGMSCRWRGLSFDGGIILAEELMECVSN